MNAQRWQQIDRLFQAALERPIHERARLLDEGCAADQILRSEVESLLVAHAVASSGFIEACPFESQQQVEQAAEPLLGSGRRIGRYTLANILGRGGSGFVYEAVQDEPARTVAVKVLPANPRADDLTARLFYRESQALARLKHPGIAAIYEAGSAADCYYFAMERVEGAPLTTFAISQNLSIRQRLDLFRRVCEAVHFAHQHGVIHRDLKPSNILVTASGQPKVLDFGLARIAEPDVSMTRVTEVGTFQGTLAYASPEQVRGPEKAGDGADVRSDVYSLGVILYELLSGRWPYDVDRLTIPAAVRVICEQPPRSLAGTLPVLRGDVDTIVLKAIEKDPERRYSSAAAFAEDIERHLTHQPILARPASVGYQLRKFVRRHRALAAGVLIGAACLVGGALATTLMWLHAQAAADLATREQAKKEFINQFLLDTFNAAAPEMAGRDLTARALLDRAAARLRASPPADGLLEADLHVIVGDAFNALSLHQSARPHFERAVDLRRAKLGPVDAATIDARRLALAALAESGARDEGVARLVELLSESRAQLGERHAVTIAIMLDRVRVTPIMVLRRRPEAVEPRVRGLYAELVGQAVTAWSYYRDTVGADHDDTLAAQALLARLYSNGSELDQALPLARALVEQWRGRGAADPRDRAALAESLGALAHYLARSGQHEQVEEPISEAVAIDAELHGPTHGLTLLRRGLRAQMLRDRLSPAEVEADLRGAVAGSRTLFGPHHQNTITALIGLGQHLEQTNREDEADELYRQADEACRVVDGPLSRGRLTVLFRSTRRLGFERRMQVILEEIARIVAEDSATAEEAFRALLEHAAQAGIWPIARELVRQAFDGASGGLPLEPLRAADVVADVVEWLEKRPGFSRLSQGCGKIVASALEHAGDDAEMRERLTQLAARCADRRDSGAESGE